MALEGFGQGFRGIFAFTQGPGSRQRQSPPQGQPPAHEHGKNAEFVKAQDPDSGVTPDAQVFASEGHELEHVGDDKAQDQGDRGQHAIPMPGDFSVSDSAYARGGKNQQHGHVQRRSRPIGKFCVHGISIAPGGSGLG